MGDAFSEKERPLAADIRIIAESIEPIKKVIVIGNGETLKEISLLNEPLIDIKTRLTLSCGIRYIRVKIIDRNKSIAFSNPIYVRRPLSKKQIVKIFAGRGYEKCKYSVKSVRAKEEGVENG